YASHRHAWWRCPYGDVWRATIVQRTRLDTGCPVCARTRFPPERSLARRAPVLARQWHPTKNGELTPHDVTCAWPRRVWWKCPKGPDHEWEANVRSRAYKAHDGCPFCANQRVSVTNALATCSTRLARDWHPTRNGTLSPRDVTNGSSRRVWWRCVSA